MISRLLMKKLICDGPDCLACIFLCKGLITNIFPISTPEMDKNSLILFFDFAILTARKYTNFIEKYLTELCRSFIFCAIVGGTYS